MMILTLTEKQAALLSHAIVEFQDTMHRQSFEDETIDESCISELQNLVDQIIDQTKVEVLVDISPDYFTVHPGIGMKYRLDSPSDSVYPMSIVLRKIYGSFTR